MPQSNENTSESAVIWRFRDGRAGHENQVVGLSEAIARKCNVQLCDIYLNRSLRGLKSLLPHRLSFATNLPAPNLLVGAGHSTHLPLLTFQQRFGGKTVVIMKPSLPTALFDLCLIPTHDRLIFQPRNVIRTEGSLNRIQPGTGQNSRKGIFLIGGPSRHFAWSDENVLRQIRTITQKEQMQWTLATSERTPESFVLAWRSKVPEIPIVTSQECSSQWLPEQLSKCGTAWVTCDSMSMIYEALTAGSRVGLLELPQINDDRISRNVQRLITTAFTVTSSQWLAGHKLPIQIRQFSESNRCAAIIEERLLQPVVAETSFRPSTDLLKGSLVAADFGSLPVELNSRLAPESLRS
jgi:mitochondrial fission protein ELM1